MKVYQKYLIKEFILISLKISFVFCVLGFVMGVLEEFNFFSDYNVKYYFPIFLVILNLPSIIYEIFPFIFLIIFSQISVNLVSKNNFMTLIMIITPIILFLLSYLIFLNKTKSSS